MSEVYEPRNNMDKLFAIVLLIAGVAFAAERTEEETAVLVKKTQEYCQKESKVSDEVLSNAKKLNYDSSNRNLQCYAKCMLTNWKLLEADGKINVQAFTDSLSGKMKPMLVEGAEKCKNEDDPDLCVKAMKIYECNRKLFGSKFVFY